MQAALLRVQTANAFTLHEIRSATGTTIREYVSSSGDVFGVAWDGPAMPDLNQVLGAYFPAYQRAVQQQRQTRRARGPLSIDDGDLVVQVSGHQRSLSGRAYVKRMVPASVDASAIR